MKTLRRIWMDVRQGQNIDVYILILVSIVLAILAILGFVPVSWLYPIILSVLALLAYSILNIVHKLGEVHTIISSDLQKSLLQEFPDDLWEKIEKEASDIWLIGSSSYYIFSNKCELFKTKLEGKCSIKILLRDPTQEMCQLASRYRADYFSPSEMQTRIQSSLNRACELKKVAPKLFQLRVIDYPLSFNIGAINLMKQTGIIYIEYHQYKMNTKDGGGPKLIITNENKFWYEFFKKQILTVWKDGYEWQCNERLTPAPADSGSAAR
jgi:hypothetical protein